MDEMDEYRERIERRHEERRMKNDRRQAPAPQPKSTDWFFWIDMAFFALIAVGYYIATKN